MKYTLSFIVLILIIAVCFGAWKWSQNNVLATPTNKSPQINKICSSLPRKNGSYSTYTVSIYTNTEGEVGGYHAFDPEMDGGASFYFDSKGDLIGKWGNGIPRPDNDPSTKQWSDIIASHDNKSTIQCNK
ncbi:MAG: hypothetical protein RLZZ480_480 [Candidatus Parcubacteria bacterium]|jgi:hypothetical protein